MTIYRSRFFFSFFSFFSFARETENQQQRPWSSFCQLHIDILTKCLYFFVLPWQRGLTLLFLLTPAWLAFSLFVSSSLSLSIHHQSNSQPNNNIDRSLATFRVHGWARGIYPSPLPHFSSPLGLFILLSRPCHLQPCPKARAFARWQLKFTHAISAALHFPLSGWGSKWDHILTYLVVAISYMIKKDITTKKR